MLSIHLQTTIGGNMSYVWQMELLFKECKSHNNLHKFDTEKEPIAEALIWASLAASSLKRFLAHAAEHLLEVVISTRKAAMSSAYALPDLFRALRDGDGPGYRRIRMKLSASRCRNINRFSWLIQAFT
jgi:hypothetical protein